MNFDATQQLSDVLLLGGILLELQHSEGESIAPIFMPHRSGFVEAIHHAEKIGNHQRGIARTTGE